MQEELPLHFIILKISYLPKKEIDIIILSLAIPYLPIFKMVTNKHMNIRL